MRYFCVLVCGVFWSVGVWAELPKAEADFLAYLNKVETHLLQNSLAGRSEAGIRLNMPFELVANPLVPYRGKFLLIHGLNDSPFVWRDMAEDLVVRGFDVRGILLPGHGSHPKQTIDVHYRDWLKAARTHLKFWNTDDTPLYLGGFSLGGVIATTLALEEEGLAGLLLFSPAYNSRLNHLLRWSWLYSSFNDWLFGQMLIEDNPAKYNSISINSGAQYYGMTRYLKRHWKGRKLDLPTLMVVTGDDSVVDVEYTRKLFQKRFIAKQRKLLVFSNDEELLLKDQEQRQGSYHPEFRILNQSHLSLMNAPDNSLYGGEDGVLICNGNEYPIFMACMNSQEHWFGAQHTPSPDGVAVARSTINPDYEVVLEVFDAVFGGD